MFKLKEDIRCTKLGSKKACLKWRNTLSFLKENLANLK